MKRSILIIAAAGLLMGTAGGQTWNPGAGDTSFPTKDYRSLQIEKTIMPAFPATLLAKGITDGVARILIAVDDKGVLKEWLVLAYTDELFADEAVYALERWHFDPMLVRGQAVSCQSEVVFNFEATGVVVSMTASDAVSMLLASRGTRLAYRPCRFSELDRIPEPVLTQKPMFPIELAEKGIHGSVTVEFYIDELGTVRMPAIINTDHQELSFLAIEAVENWRFEPPTHNGQPVLTRVRQRFDFTGKQQPS